MDCNNCGAKNQKNICEYCGATLVDTQEPQGNWPIALFVEDSYVDEETNIEHIDYFAYDIVTGFETDTISNQEECLTTVKNHIVEYIKDEELTPPTEEQIKKDKYIKKLTKYSKYSIVYLNI